MVAGAQAGKPTCGMRSLAPSDAGTLMLWLSAGGVGEGAEGGGRRVEGGGEK